MTKSKLHPHGGGMPPRTGYDPSVRTPSLSDDDIYEAIIDQEHDHGPLEDGHIVEDIQDLDHILDSIEVSTDVTDDIDLVASDSAALMQNCLDEN